jgi:hypothetical protein
MKKQNLIFLKLFSSTLKTFKNIKFYNHTLKTFDFKKQNDIILM